MTHIVILASGNGTDCEAVMTAAEQGQIPDAAVVAVIADRPAPVLERARRHGVTALLVDRQGLGRTAYDTTLAAALSECGADLIVLAGYLRMVSTATVTAYRNRIINVHPSLIPAFCGHGFYGVRVHQAVLDAGVRLTGVTVHFIDEGTDSGPIILQEAVKVLETDDAATLAARVLVVEHRLLPQAVALYCAARLRVQGRQVHIMGEDKR